MYINVNRNKVILNLNLCCLSLLVCEKNLTIFRSSIKGIHGWIVCGTSWSHRRISRCPGEVLAEPGKQETSRWDPAGRPNNQPWITFLPVNYLFKMYLFHTINIICFQMFCYSCCVRHVCLV